MAKTKKVKCPDPECGHINTVTIDDSEDDVVIRFGDQSSKSEPEYRVATCEKCGKPFKYLA